MELKVNVGITLSKMEEWQTYGPELKIFYKIQHGEESCLCEYCKTETKILVAYSPEYSIVSDEYFTERKILDVRVNALINKSVKGRSSCLSGDCMRFFENDLYIFFNKRQGQVTISTTD